MDTSAEVSTDALYTEALFRDETVKCIADSTTHFLAQHTAKQSA
jgi:hypothetical protein